LSGGVSLLSQECLVFSYRSGFFSFLQRPLHGKSLQISFFSSLTQRCIILAPPLRQNHSFLSVSPDLFFFPLFLQSHFQCFPPSLESDDSATFPQFCFFVGSFYDHRLFFFGSLPPRQGVNWFPPTHILSEFFPPSTLRTSRPVFFSLIEEMDYPLGEALSFFFSFWSPWTGDRLPFFSLLT